MQNENGDWISDDPNIKSLGICHFKKSFEDDNLTSISAQLKIIRLFPSFFESDEKEVFSSVVTISEVEKALKYFKKDKAPGPNGWPVEFYLTFFDLLGPHLVKMVESFRVLGRVSPALNSTFITLIPNTDRPVNFADFRPISLCNLCYKLISKIAAMRLKPFLDKAISPQQFGFLKN